MARPYIPPYPTPVAMLRDNVTLTLCELGYILGRSLSPNIPAYILKNPQSRRKLIHKGMPQPFMMIGISPVWAAAAIRAWLDGTPITYSQGGGPELVINNDNLIATRLAKMVSNPKPQKAEARPSGRPS